MVWLDEPKTVILLRVGAVAVPLMTLSFAIFAWKVKEVKRRGWLLTTLAAIFVCPRAITLHVKYALPLLTFDEAKVTSSDAGGDLSVCFFVWYLLVDTVLGAACYPEVFGVVTGWIHHCFYVGFYLYTLYANCSVGASVTFALELPVVVLGLGHVFPRHCRADYLFGLLFLLFRILYHAWLGLQWSRMHDPLHVLWPVIVAILGVHLHWFHKWITGLRRRLAARYSAKGTSRGTVNLTSLALLLVLCGIRLSICSTISKKPIPFAM